MKEKEVNDLKSITEETMYLIVVVYNNVNCPKIFIFKTNIHICFVYNLHLRYHIQSINQGSIEKLTYVEILKAILNIAAILQ